MSKTKANEQLLSAIRSRAQKPDSFGYGILTADKHVQNVLDHVGITECYKLMTNTKSQTSFNDIMVKAANTLVYSNDDMRVKDTDNVTSGMDLPRNTLMVFRHTLTSTRKDRDGDILRTSGADIDPKMLLLWQHVHTLPIGKMVAVHSKSDDRLELISAIVDMNELSHDAAVMIDNDMARFSHGFRALEFEELVDDKGEAIGGFDVTKFEIMEESLVSVPSNTDANVEEVILSLVDGGKLTSPLMKEWGKGIRNHRDISVPVCLDLGDGKKITLTLEETRENQDEDKSVDEGRGTDKGKTSTPEETNAKDTKQSVEKEESNTEEVKNLCKPVTGSWEDIEQKLRVAAKSYLTSMRVSIGEDDWVWLAATFVDHAIICIEKPRSGVIDEFRYFKTAWEMTKGEPAFIGEPEEVNINTTVEISERSPLYKRKQEAEGDALDAHKQLALSKANETHIRDAKESIDEVVEMDIPRSAKAMLRWTSRDLDTVLNALGTNDETEHIPTAKESMGTFLGTATEDEQSKMLRTLQTIEKQKRRSKRLSDFQAMMSGNGKS